MGNRDRVRKLKIVILLGPYIVVMIPIIMCIVMLFMMHNQNMRIGGIEEQISDVVNVQTQLAQSVDDTQGQLEQLNKNVDDLSISIQKLKDNKNQGNIRTADSWPKKVYLTFDDGPSANTGKILEILDSYGVKGNFFVVGTQSDNLIQYYKKIVEDGHVLGMHSYSHKYSDIYASKNAFVNDLDRIYTLIYETTGTRPHIYRFPGGSSNNVSRVPMDELIDILKERDITYYDWNILSGDATNPVLPTEDIVRNSLANIEDYEEAMILFHDLSNKTTTVEALPVIIEALLEQGISIAPIDDTTMLIQHNSNDK